MKNIKLAFVTLFLVLTGLWLFADTLLPQPLTYFSFRGVFVQYSGVLTLGAMSGAMVLALRPKWLEPHLRGLDKMYRLHKWLGIGALVVGTLHWWWAKGTKWMVGWGWLTKPARGAQAGETPGAVEAWLRGQRGLAESVGEWAFYAAAVLIVLALVKRFPYHQFVKTHKLLAVTYLLFVFHSTVLTDFDYWAQPIGWVVAAMMIAGTIAAVIVLSGRVGASRRARGTIEALTYYPELKVLETSIRLDSGWAGHKAGQFAFVKSTPGESPHPYTIASAWNPEERQIVFITKALGDHTARLRDGLKVGAPVTVEGPYGCFAFRDQRPHQIWVGAGIGITPFIARMKDLAQRSGAQAIDLFHPTSEFDQAAIDKLTADARAANVTLHLYVDSRDGRLNADKIRAAVPQWKSASIWFCGPPGFGQALREDFVAHGLAPSDFHQELFQMR